MGTRARADYDALIKLLLIGDSGEQECGVSRAAQPRAMSHRPVQAGLLAQVMLSRTDRRVKLTFIGSGGQVVMTCGRGELHRILEMLARRAESCRWALETPWVREAG